jgi:hypothetical protein
MGLKVIVQIDTTVPSGGRIRVVNQSVTGPAGAPGTNGTNGVGVPTGGTTGQALTKASNTNYDTTWTTISSGIPATLLDAKGDLIVASAADTAARLAVGANGLVLTADSAESGGIKWSRSSPTTNLWGRYYKDSVRTYNNAPGIATNAASNASCAQIARWWLWGSDRPVTVTIRVRVQTLEVGATARLAIYRLNDDLIPTTLVEDFGTVSASTTGTKSVTGTIAVSGPFAVAVWASNHSTVRYTRAATTIAEGNLLFGDSTAYNGQYGMCWGVEAVDYSAQFPSTAPTVAIRRDTDNLIMPAVSFS